MKHRISKMLVPVVEVIARFWPMSKTEDRVLDELTAAYTTEPDERTEPVQDVR
jgi:hypothetical protein